ncbi:MAG: FAD-dependent oxidoreductase, partial [Acidobacteria bacterium]|nr:FAD-dependent oxidoreductase [Acidobacteriota bacterium]
MNRIVVVGAGVIGLLCAYELRKRGADVTILDKGKPGGACSLGNAGWIVPSFSTPLPAPGLTWTALRWMLRRDS